MNESDSPQLWPKSGHVKLTKMEAVKSPDGMLREGYWLRGVLAGPLSVGHPIRVLRYQRAAQSADEMTPVDHIGNFQSSDVLTIERLSRTVAKLYTFNSVWRVEFLSVPAPEAMRQGEGNIS